VRWGLVPGTSRRRSTRRGHTQRRSLPSPPHNSLAPCSPGGQGRQA
jgi:hypothetical protein